jgi:hypothetical protein
MSNDQSSSVSQRITIPNASEDIRFYVPCPKRKSKTTIPMVKCFGCEFATGSSRDSHVEIGCGFPVGRIMKKPWRRKGSNVTRQPRVNKIERDGLS